MAIFFFNSNKYVYTTSDFSSDCRSAEINIINIYICPIISLSCLGAHTKRTKGSEGFCAETFDETFKIKSPSQSAAVRMMAKARRVQMTSGTGQCVTAAVMNFSQAESKSRSTPSLTESH